MRWRRDDRQAPDEPRDDDAESWLSEFRPVRPDALTAADGDAASRRAVENRARLGEPAQPPARREDLRARPVSGGHPQPEPGDRRPAVSPPGSPRSDLERDVGPWAGLRPPSAHEPDRREARQADAPGWPSPRGRARRPDRRPAEDADTDRFRQPVRDYEYPPAGPAPAERRDHRTAGRREPAAERRPPDAFPPGRGPGERRGQPDHDGHTPGRDGSGRGYDGRSGRPGGMDARRLGPDVAGYPGYRPEGRYPSRRDEYGGRAPADQAGDGPARPLSPLAGAGGHAEPWQRRDLPVPPDTAMRPGGGRPDPARPDTGRPGLAQPVRPDTHSAPLDRDPHPDAGPPGRGAAASPGLRRDAAELPVHRPRSDYHVRPAAPAPADQSGQPAPGVRPDNGSFPAPGRRPDSRGGESQRPQPLVPERALRAEPVLPRPPELPRPAGPAPRPVAEPPAAGEPASPAPGAPGVRPDLVANLTLADLARVRQALALLSDDPATGSADGPAPSLVAADSPAVPDPGADADDEADTFPLPVILPGATAVARPEPVEAPRGPFEPARPGQPAGAAEPEPPEPEPSEPESADGLPPAAAAKLDQIKDLLLTAEAIGEANLDRHFDQVSQRQRELIREFFERAAPGRERPG